MRQSSPLCFAAKIQNGAISTLLCTPWRYVSQLSDRRRYFIDFLHISSKLSMSSNYIKYTVLSALIYESSLLIKVFVALNNVFQNNTCLARRRRSKCSILSRRQIVSNISCFYLQNNIPSYKTVIVEQDKIIK